MEKEQEKKNRPPPSQKARAPFTGDSLHPPHNANESEQTFSSRVNDIDDNNDAFADTSRTLHNEAESNGEKEWLQQLLLQRSGVPATPTILVIVVPSSSAVYGTSIPRTYHKGQHYLSRSGYPKLPRRRTQGRSSKHMTL